MADLDPAMMSSMGRRRLGTALLLLAVIAFGGCQRALFPPDVPRTQYDKYDVMRNRYKPTEQLDVFGNPQPAIRARLSRGE
jgi:hypothetical protein